MEENFAQHRRDFCILCYVAREADTRRAWSGFVEVEAFEARSKKLLISLGAFLRNAIAIAALQRTAGDETPYRLASYRLVTTGSTQSLEIMIEWDGTSPQRSYIVYYVSGTVV